MRTQTVYLIHFEQPYRHARHYLGSTRNLEARIESHRSGKGARLMEVLKQHGINFTVVRTWNGDRRLERRLKNRKNSPRLCPCCNARLKTP